jgi:hypothetical protein
LYQYHADPPSDGEVNLMVDAVGKNLQPTEEQRKAFAFLLEQEDEITDLVLSKIAEIYPAKLESFRDGYGYYEDKQEFEDSFGEEDMPELKSISQLKSIIRLRTVYIMDYAKKGYAYVGLEFGCNWEEENGFGIMLHKTDVIQAGDATASFDYIEDDEKVSLKRLPVEENMRRGVKCLPAGEKSRGGRKNSSSENMPVSGNSGCQADE